MPEGGLYHYLLPPSEEPNDQHKRATSRIWSKATYRLKGIVEDSGNRMMYYLSHGPGRVFVSEELMLIPESTELPPDYIQNGDIYPTGIDIAMAWWHAGATAGTCEAS